MPDTSKKLIGEFELFPDRLIGKGAWGEVYHGQQRSLNRPVAIKILKKELTQDPDFVIRFRRESETLAKMSDDHIMHVYSAGEFEGSHYFIMEYLEGQPLSAFVEAKHKFTLEEIIYITESVAQALNTAWTSPARIVHRDIKPSNIMVCYKEPNNKLSVKIDTAAKITTDNINILKTKIKVMDFGLAKVSESGQEATMAGTIIGTPKYISPEQGLGNQVDIRSDIYSLGMVMYEMATGRIPFDSESAVSMIRHHVHDTITLPSQFNPDISPDLEKIILKCTQKEPEIRYTDPQQLLDDLSALRVQHKPVYASNPSVEATLLASKTRKPSHKKLALLYSGTAIILLGLVYYFISKSMKDPALINNTNPKTQNIIINHSTPDTNTPPVLVQTLPRTLPVNEWSKEFKVKIWTNKEPTMIYKAGDELKIYFQTNKDSYVYLYYKDAAGHVKLIVPNEYKQDNKVLANKTYSYPDETMNFILPVEPPFGTEQIMAIGSLQPIKDLDIEKEAKRLQDIGIVSDFNKSDLRDRGVGIIPKEERAETIYTITTNQ
jgi:serine/threonine protein kinase